MRLHDVAQRSPEWIALRVGKLTASRAGAMLATTSKGWAASRRNLLMQLALERVTGQSQESGYQSQAMQDGIEREPIAVACYQELTGVTVQPIGFVSHDELPVGCSPDGFIGDDGLLSVKCPIPATHWDYLKSRTVPDDYMKQILHEFWITGRRWCDFFSYQPFFPERLRTALIRVPRVEADVAKYEQQALTFLKEVDVEVGAILTMDNFTAVLQAVTK